jgi:hypothetical protein
VKFQNINATMTIDKKVNDVAVGCLAFERFPQFGPGAIRIRQVTNLIIFSLNLESRLQTLKGFGKRVDES